MSLDRYEGESDDLMADYRNEERDDAFDDGLCNQCGEEVADAELRRCVVCEDSICLNCERRGMCNVCHREVAHL